jgi:hypothetical protein
LGAYVENVEKIFHDEVRDKKRTGRGAFSMRGKGVKHGISGALKTPYYYMSQKEKKKLNGKVEVFKMYETIIPKEEFELKDEDTQKKMLTRWREIYSTKEIKQQMNIANSPFYALIKKLDVPVIPRENRKDKTKKKAEPKKNIAISPESLDKLEAQAPAVRPEDYPQAEPHRLFTKGLHLEFNGSYDCDSLNKLFTKLQLLIDGEENEYYINLSLTEKQKS